ncbi:hypothetical protein OEZ85_012652 [Tetradesmus obliquus]|uniref:Uncharacterized protein n=1 Tax=Tetradesmus obliquus TaxID=3088 RepID=A0ABY8U8B7_TETOB|nr:hypothetical protein OEZ85_012652 [Tetradesmus obliquus]
MNNTMIVAILQPDLPVRTLTTFANAKPNSDIRRYIRRYFTPTQTTTIGELQQQVDDVRYRAPRRNICTGDHGGSAQDWQILKLRYDWSFCADLGCPAGHVAASCRTSSRSSTA